MYDIVFYYTEGFPESEIEKTKFKFPSAHFIQIGNDRNFVMSAKRISKDIKTLMFWLIPIEATVDKYVLKYKVPEWDTPYVHYEKMGTLDLFLVPKDHTFTDDQFEKKFFNDVKFVEFNLFSRCVYDIFFISYNEPNAEINFQSLKKRFPEVKRVKDVKGIFNAHLEAANNSSTNFFWVVDADAEVVEKFNFSYEVPPWDFDVTHIWKSANIVNGLSYGNGGVKLFPKHLFFQADEESIDVSTSLGYKIKVIDEVSNINNFATDEFSAWRSAFRECTKLSGKVIYGHVDKESEQRLSTWCTFASGKFKAEVIDGAKAGYAYGRKNMGNPSALLKINDFDWLKEQFLLKDQQSDVGPLNINVAESKAASAMGHISGTTLTVSAMISGTIHVGMLVSNSTRMSSTDEMIEPGTEIVSGTGAFWKVSVSQKKGSQDSPININIY